MDVLTYLAEKLQSNIRQIEGVMKKLGANHFLSGMPITIEMVRSTVPEFIR
jgi:chromosomal replication initiation ATPase DnaA